jgi:N-dimethylarginine dimethylaminohydrolase
MSTVAVPSAGTRARRATPRRYLMCPPTHFDVAYAINPWMDPSTTVDRDLATSQWEQLRDTYLQLGHDVEVIDPVAGLPDMVFAANGGLVVDGRAFGARFRHAERAAEADAYLAWLRTHVDPGATAPTAVNEAEGDLLVVGDVVLAGTGFRTDRDAHAEVAAWSGREVVTLELVDPRWYHLDTAVAVLDDATIAWFPPAFAPSAREELRRRYPRAIEATPDDAAVLGLNAVSDGRHVVLPSQATTLAHDLATAGFEPVPVDLSELLRAGGGPKCCTMELRPTPSPRIPRMEPRA